MLSPESQNEETMTPALKQQISFPATPAEALESGESDLAIMDHLARDPVESGYLHSRVRRWIREWKNKNMALSRGTK